MEEEKSNNPRMEIDRIDGEILRLLNERAAIALRVGAIKKNDDKSLCDPRRESEVLTRLQKENPGPLDEQSVASIFQRIIDESLHLQQKKYHQPFGSSDSGKTDFENLPTNRRVAFLGEPGTFSETAAIAGLGENCQTVSCPTFEDLFKAIEREQADFILTPLENSLVGSVHRCYDLLLQSSLCIVAEIFLPVAHYLIGGENATLETVQTVESHPVALAQCERFFAAHPALTGIAADDTAGSVKRAVESRDPTRAAVGGRRAAAIYGGKILREHIEDHTENFTRFALLSANAETDGAGDKISLVLRLTHKSGALHDALRPFVRRGIDLLKIESRPIKDAPAQFNFYLDLKAPASESDLRGALEDIRAQAADVRFLGRYSAIRLTDEKLNQLL